MASFSISPDRMTLTLFLFFTFFHYILSPLSFFLSFRFRVFSSFYNLIDRITTINSHVRIIHQGYRSHVSRWFCRNLKFSFSTFQSFHSSWNFIIGELLFSFFFSTRMDLNWFLLSCIFSLSLGINRVWKKRRKLKRRRHKEIKIHTKVREELKKGN